MSVMAAVRDLRKRQPNVLYETFVALVRQMGIHTETGVFRTEMVVTLANDGPVTILVDSKKTF